MTDWLLSIVWYGSVVTALAAMLAMIRPMRWLRFRTRRRALATLVVALGLIALNGRVTPGTTIAAAATTEIDRLMPAFQFRERHSRTVAAPPERVLRAVKDVTASEIALFTTFTTIRRFGRAAPESILNAPERQPILDVATRTGFVLLADTDREVVVGTVVVAPRGFRAPPQRDAAWFHSLAAPGIAKAAMNFVVEPDASGARVTTDTRVFATDEPALRRFTPYWRTIFPGSWVLRVTWLDAIAARAEGAS